jgi:hypothetical protein
VDPPVRSKREVEIAAPPEVVWDVLTGFEQWTQWNLDVKTMSIDGPVEAGTEFRWKAGPGTIVSTLEQVDPPGYIRWRGRTLSVKAIHEWRLEPANSGTRVETDESFSGLLARLFHGSLQKTLDRSTESGLEQLKREAERRATA